MKCYRPFMVCALVLLMITFLSSCGSSGSSTTTTSDTATDTNHRQLMRGFVEGISAYAKSLDANFIIIPQNGHALLTQDGEETGDADATYLAAIDGMGREDLFYGYDEDDEPTPDMVQNEMIAFMDIAEANDVQVLVTDYCSTESFMDDSYQQNADRGYISFAADERELNSIPEYPVTPHNVNASDVTTLAAAQNFLYLLNPDAFDSKDDFISAVSATNYDLVITDLYFQGEEELSAADVSDLKTKANDGARLVIAYMSIGEAEDYRYYWQSDWNAEQPEWIAEENEDWPGNYKVEYWDTDWQGIIYGNDDSYLKKIISAGFDGVYLDIIDAYEYFE